MQFKTALLGTQYLRLHPELRRVLGELGAQLKDWGQHPAVLTDASRTREEQEALYWRSPDYKGLPEVEARMRARRRFSYHLVDCAADLRVTDPQRALAWLCGYLRVARTDWELLVHNVGTGIHLHVAFKDAAKRKEFETRSVA